MAENEEMTAEELAAMEAEQARLEAEERARIEHENMLNSFPETHKNRGGEWCNIHESLFRWRFR